MTLFDHRSLRTLLIPWVITVVALIGVNALAPDHARIRKNDSSEGTGLWQLTDDAHPPGRISNPLVFLAPHPIDGIWAAGLSSRLPCIETRRDQAGFQSRDGAIRGRAPPAWPIAGMRPAHVG